MTGVLDWVNASWGPPGVDIAHCRLNLALLHGPDTADRFLDACQAEFGPVEYDLYWDVQSTLDSGQIEEPHAFPGWTDAGVRGLSPRLMRERLEEHLARSVARR